MRLIDRMNAPNRPYRAAPNRPCAVRLIDRAWQSATDGLPMPDGGSRPQSHLDRILEADQPVFSRRAGIVRIGRLPSPRVLSLDRRRLDARKPRPYGDSVPPTLGGVSGRPATCLDSW